MVLPGFLPASTRSLSVLYWVLAAITNGMLASALTAVKSFATLNGRLG
jgi:hypothetical protein